MHFNKLYRFLLFPDAGFFKFEAVKKLGTLDFSNGNLGIPDLGFLKTKRFAYILTTKPILGYEIDTIKADTSLKCSQLLPPPHTPRPRLTSG